MGAECGRKRMSGARFHEGFFFHGGGLGLIVGLMF